MATLKTPKPDPALACLVDELGDLDRELAPLQPKLARQEMLRKSLRQRYDDAPANETAEAQGARYVVLVGARGFSTAVSITKLVRAIGAKAFQRIASVTLRALEAEFSHVVPDVTTKEQIGPRSLKLYEKGKA